MSFVDHINLYDLSTSDIMNVADMIWVNWGLLAVIISGVPGLYHAHTQPPAGPNAHIPWHDYGKFMKKNDPPKTADISTMGSRNVPGWAHCRYDDGANIGTQTSFDIWRAK